MRYSRLYKPTIDQCRLSSPECPENSSYNSCGTNCEDTCESLLNEYPRICNFGCNEGCFCDRGYVRDQTGGKCVPVESCHRVPKVVTVCKENSTWSECKARIAVEVRVRVKLNQVFVARFKYPAKRRISIAKV